MLVASIPGTVMPRKSALLLPLEDEDFLDDHDEFSWTSSSILLL
jgi:hypothetical protein